MTPSAISIIDALAKIHDLIKLLKNSKPHYPIVNHRNNTTLALDQLENIYYANNLSNTATIAIKKPI